MTGQLNWVREALNWLLQNGRINVDQYYVFLNYYQTQINNFDMVQKELTQIYQQNDPRLIEQKYRNIIDIINIEIIEEPTAQNDMATSIKQNQEQPENYNQNNNITMSAGGKQKKLGHHPLYKKAGFMNILLFIFLTGISSGIILMIILNLLVK